QSKLLSRLPYVHLLPSPIYRALLKGMGESPETVEELISLRESGLSIEKFEKVIRRAGLTVTQKQFYFVNPIYEYKFKLRPRVVPIWLSRIPYLRNLYTTGVYYTVGLNGQ